MDDKQKRVQELIKQMYHKIVERQWEAENALVQIGKPAVPALIEVSKGGRYYQAERAVFLLGRIKDTSAVPSLVSSLKHANPQVREMAAHSLGKIGDVSSVPALVEVFKDEWIWYMAFPILETILKNCKSTENVQNFEDKLAEGLARVKNKFQDKEELRKVEIAIAKLKMRIADKKNELAAKKDMLLPYKPKTPKKGQIYQRIKRIRNG